MDSKKISYRKAEEKDISVLTNYRIEFLNEIFPNKTELESEKLRNCLNEYFSKALSDKTLIAWFAEYKNQVIGTSCLVIWKAPPSYSGIGKSGKRGYILNMFTLKEFRKKGVASILLEKLKEEAKGMELEFVHLHATKDGIGVYKNIGFEEPFFPELTLKI
ncbi:MAG: GNAT family N-acetyltransferase [Calditrichaeota bacterium]|nr:MAG: GNAT family N-acetyltransferase [Calditrichota bacterium]